jgi:hypothetical protein
MKKKKKRAKKYDTKVAITGTLDDVLKASVQPSKKVKKAKK